VQVACSKVGVSIRHVEQHLDYRALKVRRRPGDAKQERIDEAKKILDTASKADATELVSRGLLRR
jgi:hypothetical protein